MKTRKLVDIRIFAFYEVRIDLSSWPLEWDEHTDGGMGVCIACLVMVASAGRAQAAACGGRISNLY